MKGLPRYDLNITVAFLCMIVVGVTMSFISIEAQGVNISTAEDLLVLKERELSMFVDAVEANSRNCDAFNGCSNANCSRLSCYEFAIPNTKYECLGVTNNTFCNASRIAPCVTRTFDFSKGYIRRVDQVNKHVARTVCTHRTLDDHFRNSTMVDPLHFFRVFFGAVDGTFRIYPGADESCELVYDPRVRPWYRVSTHVPKVVSLLIDTGLNMRENISGDDAQTFISKAIATAVTFLDTLEEDEDYVTLICFDGDRIQYRNDIMKYNKQLLYQSFSDSLSRIVFDSSKSDPSAVHTNNAINAAINNMSNSNAIPASYLKVVIALIGGQQYEDIQDLHFSIVPNMNVFIYSFRTRRVPQCDPAIRASLEKIPDDRLNNPLFALQSYYSFLAKLHRSYMKNLTDYGPQYEDFTGVDAHTVTLSKAAFGPNGELLGVMGLDFFEHLVEKQFPTIQFPSIVERTGKHDPGRIFNASRDVNINVCYNHTDACPGLNTEDVHGFLCEGAKSPDENIGCCGTCKVSTTPSSPPSMPPTSPPKKIKVWVKVVAGVGAEFGLILLSIAAILAVVVWRKIEECINENDSSTSEDRGPTSGSD